MTKRLRVAFLATAIILTPLAASASVPIDARTTSPRSAGLDKPLPNDDASPPETFPSPIHWAMIAVGVTFAGAAVYIHRRRGFDVDASD
jgi:hypothetical protein